jgi:DNA-binding GntR family transcriptional regulator
MDIVSNLTGSIGPAATLWSELVPRPTRPPSTPAAAEGPPDVVPIARHTVTSQATEALRDRILRGDYGDDAPLRQDALAAELGVSRIPVREALRQLEAEGLVVFHPHRGAVVSTLSTSEIEELFELRAQIESDLVRRAVPHATRDVVARAREILRSYDAAFRAGEISGWGTLNWEFHATLYAPAERSFTMAVVQRLHQQSDRYFRMQLALTHGESRASVEHRGILAAVEAHDARRAALLMRQHILGAGRQLVRFLATRRADAAGKTSISARAERARAGGRS